MSLNARSGEHIPYAMTWVSPRNATIVPCVSQPALFTINDARCQSCACCEYAAKLSTLAVTGKAKWRANLADGYPRLTAGSAHSYVGVSPSETAATGTRGRARGGEWTYPCVSDVLVPVSWARAHLHAAPRSKFALGASEGCCAGKR